MDVLQLFGLDVWFESVLTAAFETYFESVQVLNSNRFYFFVSSSFIVFLFVVSLRINRMLLNENNFIVNFIRIFGAMWILVSIMTIVALLTYSVLAYFISKNYYSAYFNQEFWRVVSELSVLFLFSGMTGVLGGGWCYFSLGRHVESKLSKWLEKCTLKSLPKSAGISDVRNIHNDIPVPVDFDPRKYFRFNMDDMFLGIDENMHPVRISRVDWCVSGVQAMGCPGAGKGVIAQTALYQSLGYDDAVYSFDVKRDEYMVHVLIDACKHYNRPHIIIDLNSSNAQFNILKRITPKQLYELFTSAFSLGRTGDGGVDYYRNFDRKAARILSELARDSEVTFSHLYDAAPEILGKELYQLANNFISQLEEVSSLPVCATVEGADLFAPLNHGGLIYIIGSMKDESVIFLQKMLIVRIVQLIENRDIKGNKVRHCSIFADEVKYLISKQFVNTLGSVRDKKANIILTHQSLGDFSDPPDGMTVASVRETIVDTTPLKWLYRQPEEGLAKWIAGYSGKIVVGKERKQVVRNRELSETRNSDITLDEVERYRFTVNHIQNLPKNCALCIGAGEPKLAFARPIRTKEYSIEYIDAKKVKRNVESLLKPDEIQSLGDTF